jgi:hypothetical protein
MTDPRGYSVALASCRLSRGRLALGVPNGTHRMTSGDNEHKHVAVRAAGFLSPFNAPIPHVMQVTTIGDSFR